MKSKVLFTDGEGPIVFKDLAADITEKVIPGFFPVLSLYDDYLAEKGTEGYQAGDTLALVIPTFLAHGVTDEDVREEAKGATVCRGVEEYIGGLKRDGWNVRIISTAYSPMWELVGRHIGVPMEDIACTNLDVDGLRSKFRSEKFLDGIRRAEENILEMVPLGEEAAKAVDGGRDVVDVFEDPMFAPLRVALDGFYFGQLKDAGYRVLDEVKVMGGRRKIGAAEGFARDLGVDLSTIAYVGDSITDDAMHARLKSEGGLPIAINGNSYALRNARVAVATEDMRDLRPLLNAWQSEGFEGVQKIAQDGLSFPIGGKEGAPRHEEPGFHYNIVEWDNPAKRSELVAVHKDFRKRVRGAATARLG